MRPRPRKALKKDQRDIRYALDCSEGKDLEVRTSDLVDFFKKSFKIDERRGRLEGKVAIKADGDKLIIQTTGYEFSKSYVKYLAKRFLARDYRDIFRIVSVSEEEYKLEPYPVGDDEEEEDGAE
ncbi:Ribosomal protein L22e [Giardia muris]|uniref:Large ribosomal subunit protein eL22 n=1 Tax=Giardia muris TaxID=5742 RepID=A0A4Z1T8J4_GIAMU|nr:Ribosomal protein L22e [Giardia muris]|eukprot:TNJ28899.1 Ribosomal protein L22e [Giardia muris]